MCIRDSLGARRAPDRSDGIRGGLVSSWAGMRGVVTLAAALTLPEETPLRAELIVIALVVTVGTLLLQGLTLPSLARALDVRGPDPREDALVEATVLGATTGAGLRLIEADPVSYTHLRAHETVLDLVCRLLLEKKTHNQLCIVSSAQHQLSHDT